MGGKDKDFWEDLKGWGMIMDEKGWERIRRRLSGVYEWGVQMVKREGKRGEA